MLWNSKIILLGGGGRRSFSISSVLLGKTKQKLKEERSNSSCVRAVDHFDDFYGSVFGKRKWPSLRLGLLSPPKYMAIPNTFTGDLNYIQTKLKQIGAYDVNYIWNNHQHLIDKDFSKKDLVRLHEMELQIASIAATKKAEEMEVMYTNDPDKIRVGSGGSINEQYFNNQEQRVFKTTGEAAFMPPTRLKGVDDFAFDSDYYSGYLPTTDNNNNNNNDESSLFKFTKESNLKFPPLFTPFTFESGSSIEFPAASKNKTTGLREYLCVNGASICPILALDLNPDVDLLDLCAGPGTKSLMALMTMCLRSLTCNDLDQYRLARVKKIFHEFLGTTTPENVTYTRLNAVDYPLAQRYSRVLADVPCLNDRTACTIPENNIFKTTRTKERLNLVGVQKRILLSALKVMSEDVGSATVYSTCTLSPVENDGVVMQALKETNVNNLYVDLIGIFNLLKPLEKYCFKLNRTRFGVVVEPNVELNFGPMFISRIVVGT